MDTLNDIEQKSYDNVINTIKESLAKGYIVNIKAVRANIREIDRHMSNIESYTILFCVNSLEEVQHNERLLAAYRGEKKAYKAVLTEYKRRLKEADKAEKANA